MNANEAKELQDMNTRFRFCKLKPLIIFLLLFPVSGAVVATDPEIMADFFVSPAGFDDWSGTFAESNAQGSDGPFATLERAHDAVRDLKTRKSSDILVLVREGVYQLDETIVFAVEDSGEGDSTITYAAWPGEKPGSPALEMDIVPIDLSKVGLRPTKL